MDSENGSKGERGRRSPSAPLQDAIGYLGSIHSSLGMGPYGMEALVEALGHKSAASGTARAKVGTLTHFKLLDRDGSVYRVSSIGKRILLPTSPQDHRQAVIEAAKAPSLYAQFLRENANSAIPQLLPNILVHRYGVIASTSQDVATIFRQSMEYAGLLRHGVLHDSPETVGNSPPASAKPVDPQQVDGQPTPSVGLPETGTTSGLMTDYRIPLTKRRSAVLRLPLPLDESDVERIKRWLDLMADVITAEEDGDDSP